MARTRHLLNGSPAAEELAIWRLQRELERGQLSYLPPLVRVQALQFHDRLHRLGQIVEAVPKQSLTDPGIADQPRRRVAQIVTDRRNNEPVARIAFLNGVLDQDPGAGQSRSAKSSE